MGGHQTKATRQVRKSKIKFVKNTIIFMPEIPLKQAQT